MAAQARGGRDSAEQHPGPARIAEQYPDQGVHAGQGLAFQRLVGDLGEGSQCRVAHLVGDVVDHG